MARLAFIMDPLSRVNINTDTTFAFMLEAFKRGHEVIYVAPSQLELQGDRVFLHGEHVDVFNKAGAHFTVRKTVHDEDVSFDAIFIRTDPPFDSAYLTATWLLSFSERRGVRVINSPSGVRSANEKLYALQFADLCPETVVTTSRAQVDKFMREHGGEAIAKPLEGHGGYGVVRLRQGDSNINALIDLLTLEGKKPVLVQEYLPGAARGDKRLLLIDGVIRGAVRRVPKADDHRGNVHVGGNVEACDIDANDERIASRMRDQLRRDGLFFVGLDVIEDKKEGKLIEVNVTSPTLVQELRRLSGVDLAVEVISSVERG
jgi:glutathione synthase